MTPRDREILSVQTDNTLAEWWCMMNAWDWPELLPDHFDRDFGYRRQRRRDIMEWIKSKIGGGVCMSKWSDKAFWDAYQV